MIKRIENPSIQIKIKQRKQLVKGHVIRAAIFGRCKVLEIVDTNKVPFYMVFFKDKPIFGAHVEQLNKESFVSTALQSGIVIDSTNPFLYVVSPQSTVSIQDEKQLFSKLQDHYSLVEVAYIATLIDLFFTKEKLNKVIHQIFNHYKRNGNFQKAFQTIQILNRFSPNLKSAQELQYSPEFRVYRQKQVLDPHYLEQEYFLERHKTTQLKHLQNLLKNEERSLEFLLIWLENPQTEQIDVYTEIALKYLPVNQWLFTLSSHNINVCEFHPDKVDYTIQQLSKEGLHEDVISLLLPFINKLPNRFYTTLSSTMENVNITFIYHHLDDIAPAFKFFQKNEHVRLDKLLHNIIIYMLSENTLVDVQKKISTIQKNFPDSYVIKKIDHMLKISEDPDKMMQLGKFYAEFEQFDEAIDCFLWEMELSPKDPSPVLYVSKMYQNKGLLNEAKAYHVLASDLKKGG